LYCISFFRGIIKNRPALGERALQELMADSLLKFNYFLTDVRGRNVKSYIKIPVPSIADPTRVQFVKNLLKHDIDVDEYCSIYEKSSIPLNNNLSKLTVEVFERNACLVTQYSKYRNQLNNVIQNHVENHFIRETEQGNFIIHNQEGFTCQFHDIENLVLGARSEQVCRKRQSVNSINEVTKSVIQPERTTTAEVNILCDTVEKNREIQHHDFISTSNDQQDIDTTGKASV
jgi:hypothetical protein